MPRIKGVEGSWTFRVFLLFIGLLICAFFGWLVWASIAFSPSVEKDVANSLLSSPLFQHSNMAILNRPSQCRTTGDVKQPIDAALIQAFRTANNVSIGSLELYRFRNSKHILDDSKTPEQWFRELETPVMAVSNVGVIDDLALVCLELIAVQEQGMFVTLQHAGADYWRIVRNDVAWQTDLDEEIPKLTIPEVE